MPYRRRTGARYAPRAAKPARQWISISSGWNAAFAGGVSTTTAAILMQMQMPTDPTALTADPPEDIVIMRVRGSFAVTLTAAAEVANWTLALMVNDVTWTPGASFAVDADKRVLWSRTFGTAADNNAYTFSPPGWLLVGATNHTSLGQDVMMLDISPKVKLEAGKALYLVAYENDDGRTLSTTTFEMRLLYQKSRRR